MPTLQANYFHLSAAVQRRVTHCHKAQSLALSRRTTSLEMVGLATNLYFLILLHIHRTCALPTNAPTQDQDTDATDGWSKDVIIGLVGVLATILCCAVALTWPSCRRRLEGWRARAASSTSLLPLDLRPD